MQVLIIVRLNLESIIGNINNRFIYKYLVV